MGSVEGSKLCANIGYSVMLLVTCLTLFVGVATPYWITQDGLSGTFSEVSCGPVVAEYKAGSLEGSGRWGDKLSDIPISDWRISAGFLLGAGVILALIFVTSIFTCCCCFGLQRCLKHLVPIIAICLLIGILFFARGLGDTEFVSSTVASHCTICTNPDNFDKGSCDYGYSIVVVIAAVILSFFSACLGYAASVDPDKMA